MISRAFGVKWWESPRLNAPSDVKSPAQRPVILKKCCCCDFELDSNFYQLVSDGVTDKFGVVSDTKLFEDIGFMYFNSALRNIA